MISNKKYVYIGLTLLFLYLLQFFLDLKWQWLFQLQQDQMYRRWSGLVLSLFILFQWWLSLTRVVKPLRKISLKMVKVHKWVGAVSPLFFYAHAMAFGYGYLLLLTYIFLVNTALGYVNLELIKSRNQLFFQGWMISHVAFSLIITILMWYHIGVVFYYK